uniref:PHD-type domain-containing protein n=1 Tax=Nicotiana tabacum TaxID=4097 RepID=A0A1S4CP90_TOBAC|nr:PREDICTED: uncharacterized protein LOC107820939 [Nicotiana tabacum]
MRKAPAKGSRKGCMKGSQTRAAEFGWVHFLLLLTLLLLMMKLQYRCMARGLILIFRIISLQTCLCQRHLNLDCVSTITSTHSEMTIDVHYGEKGSSSISGYCIESKNVATHGEEASNGGSVLENVLETPVGQKRCDNELNAGIAMYITDKTVNKLPATKGSIQEPAIGSKHELSALKNGHEGALPNDEEAKKVCSILQDSSKSSYLRPTASRSYSGMISRNGEARGNQNAKMNVCLQCGDRGFYDALVYCVQCLHAAVHYYCLDELPRSLNEFIHWVCEDCKSQECHEYAGIRSNLFSSSGVETNVGPKLKRKENPTLGDECIHEAMEDILEIKPAKELIPPTGLSDVVDDGSPLDVNKDMKNGIKNISQSNHGGKLNLGRK